MNQDLRAAAAARGVEPGYLGTEGRWHPAELEVVAAVLEALGPPPERPPFPPVIVAWDGIATPVTLDREVGDARLVLADGTEREVGRGGGSLLLPGPLPTGRHRLVVGEASALVLSVPLRAPQSPADGGWGVLAPLPWLRAAGDRGAGDLGHLGRLAEAIAPLGGEVVATLPLLAREDGQASPYSPVSRRFWDERIVDLDAAAERWGAGGERAAVRAGSERLVDAEADARCVRAVLDRLAAGPEPPELAVWLAARPDVVEYARFRAAAERHGPDWRRWPAPLRDGVVPEDAVDAAAVRARCLGQFLATTQAEELARRLAARGQVLYLDLPLGSDPLGYDSWRYRDVVVPGMSLGAPPDAFFAEGQRWGLAPLHPTRCSLDGHHLWQAAVAHHAAVAGILRIDHVMGLHRQFWVPEGAAASSGVYVRQPAEELWACLLLAAHEHGTALVGENLGTVPGEVNQALDEHGVPGMFIAQWELVPGEPALRRRVPAGVVAALNTHDLPPFAAFWREHDAARTVPAAEARDTLLEALGRSRASLVLVDAADLELAETPHNVPGTVGGGNWSRRSIRTIDELGADSGGQRSLARLDAARRRRGPAEPAATHGILLTDVDLHLLADGSHFDVHTKLGAHRHLEAGVAGTVFSVWAPDAGAVRVAGDWDGWADGTRLRPIAASGVWEAFVPGALPGHRYKLRLRTSDGAELEKADPLARRAELPPGNASVVDSTGHVWADAGWLAERPRRQAPGAPTSIYEVHLGSWRRTVPGGEPLGYREAARQLADHCNELGFTHVELLPVMEHPFTGSWGYQVTGFFAPTARYGTPDDFRWLVDHLHQRGLGVILDWVPAHFPDDPHGLARFDGSALYEHADPREGRHPDWGSLIFNYGRREVQSFLVSSAVYWLDEFHVDGLRVDAVASMLYRDYSRPAGEWIPNRYGGRENLEAIAFLRRASDEVRRRHPDVLFVAEESTSWPGVTAPTDVGGLGFTHKWDLGWMHDTLRYLSRDPVHRRWHQTDLTFRGLYHESERWVLPLSHDEVVHGKGSLLAKMPGDGWQQRASLRLLFGYQFGLPGAKLVFMGGELAQRREWDHDSSLDWRLLDDPAHAGVAAWLTALNRVYRSHASLVDEAASFRWIACDDAEHSVLVWRRSVGGDVTVWAANFTPVPRTGYRIGLPEGGRWRLVLNGDDAAYGGSGHPVADVLDAEAIPWDGLGSSAAVTLPPLAVVVYERAP